MLRLTLVAAVAVCVGWAAAAAAADGSEAVSTTPPAAASVLVRFAATDGTKLKGEIIGRGPVAIVIAHDADASYSEWKPAARFLSGHGYRVLLFDYAIDPFLSQAGTQRRGTFRYDRDIAGAVAYLQRGGARTIVLGGDGIGGLAVLVAAAELGTSVSRTFVLTAGGITGSTDTLGDPSNPDDLNALAAAHGLKTPLLLVAAGSDTNAGPLYRAVAATHKQRVTLPESALKPNSFGLAMWTSNAAWARHARADVLAFLPSP
jgi:hypothetical protein